MSDKNDWKEVLSGNLRSLNVVTVFDQHWNPLRTVEPHSHDHYQIDYFYEGHGIMNISGRSYAVKRGELYVCNPGDVHRYEAAKENPMGNLTLKFTIECEPVLIFPNHVGNVGLLSRDQQRDLESHLARACVEANKPTNKDSLPSSVFAMAFFVLLVKYLRETEKLAEEKSAGRCDAVMTYIKDHYNLHITLGELAKIAGVHPKYLCRKFALEKGITPMEALTKERMKAAKRLLRNTTLPITEIAIHAGYPSIAHFSKRFKEITGDTPKEFRRTASARFHEE